MALPAEWSRDVDAIVKDRERGASMLALQALDLLERAAASSPPTAEGLAALSDVARALRASRPSMPVIANLVNLAMDEASRGSTLPAVVHAAPAAVRKARERAQEARGAAAREAASLLRGTVLTHSASETVTKALRAAHRSGALARVVVAEGRPGFEGRTVATTLAAEGVDVLLVVDAALGLHAREADVALVGADAVLPDGGLVNKIGTRLLGLACERSGTPLYAAVDRFKVSAVAGLPLEEKGAGEVWDAAPQGVHVRNIYFDRTEPTLVTGYATDAGLLKPGEVAPLAQENAARAGWEARVRRLVR